jgi:hypothetical protein
MRWAVAVAIGIVLMAADASAGGNDVVLAGRGWQAFDFAPDGKSIVTTRIPVARGRKQAEIEVWSSSGALLEQIEIGQNIGHGADIAAVSFTGQTIELWTSNAKGDGASLIRFDRRTQRSTVTNFVLFDGFSTAQVATSRDGQMLLAEAGRNGIRLIRIWRTSEVVAGGNVALLHEWRIQAPADGVPFQGLTADGELVYTLWGSPKSPLKHIVTFTYDGERRGELSLVFDVSASVAVEPEGLGWARCPDNRMHLAVGLAYRAFYVLRALCSSLPLLESEGVSESVQSLPQ